MIVCKLEDLPTRIRSFVKQNADDDYTIIINARLSAESRRERYLHELRHIRRGDIDKQNTDNIELEAHGKSRPEQVRTAPIKGE